jgi:hypothetical protein
MGLLKDTLAQRTDDFSACAAQPYNKMIHYAVPLLMPC